MTSYSERYADSTAIAERQRDLVTRWGTRLEAGATVLELGCADGFSTECMTRSGLHVTGIDADAELLEAATRGSAPRVFTRCSKRPT